jgi:D-alanine-D-alanine ligase
LPAQLEAELKTLALDAYTILGCQDYARVDFRIDKRGKPYILEVNPNPDISKDAGLAFMAKVAGISYEGLIGEIVDFALQRDENSHHL